MKMEHGDDDLRCALMKAHVRMHLWHGALMNSKKSVDEDPCPALGMAHVPWPLYVGALSKKMEHVDDDPHDVQGHSHGGADLTLRTIVCRSFLQGGELEHGALGVVLEAHGTVLMALLFLMRHVIVVVLVVRHHLLHVIRVGAMLDVVVHRVVIVVVLGVVMHQVIVVVLGRCSTMSSMLDEPLSMSSSTWSSLSV